MALEQRRKYQTEELSQFGSQIQTGRRIMEKTDFKENVSLLVKK
jgi:hypothetical protein